MKIVKTVLVALGVILLGAMLAPSASANSILQTAGSFGVLAGSTVTNVPNPGTVIGGNLGVSPGSAITGFPPGLVTGAILGPGPVTVQAQIDLKNAYVGLAGMVIPAPINLTGQDLGGKTLTSGVYSFASSAFLTSGTGILTLDAQGKSNPFWVFQIGTTLVTASASKVQIINGAPGPNVGIFWQVGSSATLGTTTSFLGNILALTSISLNTGANISCGSALARNGAVTLDTNKISTGCNGALVIGPGGTITPVPEPGTLMLLGSGLIGYAGIIRRKLMR